MNSVDISIVSTRQFVRSGYAWIFHLTGVFSRIAKPVEMANGMVQIIMPQRIFVERISILVKGDEEVEARIVRSVAVRAVVTIPQWMY